MIVYYEDLQFDGEKIPNTKNQRPRKFRKPNSSDQDLFLIPDF